MARAKASKAEWRKKNKDSISSAAKLYFLENRLTICAKSRAFRLANPSYDGAAKKVWKQENKEKVRLYRLNHKNSKRTTGKLTQGITSKLMTLQKHQCAACHCDLNLYGFHKDHIYPLALGGKNVDLNIQLLCPTCNRKKCAKHPVEFMQSIGFLL